MGFPSSSPSLSSLRLGRPVRFRRSTVTVFAFGLLIGSCIGNGLGIHRVRSGGREGGERKGLAFSEVVRERAFACKNHSHPFASMPIPSHQAPLFEASCAQRNLHISAHLAKEQSIFSAPREEPDGVENAQSDQEPAECVCLAGRGVCLRESVTNDVKVEVKSMRTFKRQYEFADELRPSFQVRAGCGAMIQTHRDRKKMNLGTLVTLSGPISSPSPSSSTYRRIDKASASGPPAEGPTRRSPQLFQAFLSGIDDRAFLRTCGDAIDGRVDSFGCAERDPKEDVKRECRYRCSARRC